MNRTSDSLSDCSQVVERRKAGESYVDIGVAMGYSTQKVRYLCKQAMLRGEVTAEQIYYRPQERATMPVGEYELQWFLRVLGNVKVVNDCWVWQGWCNVKGYGQTSYRKSNIAIHRKMWEITRGVELETAQLICHTCDVRPCCNPSHLWQGDAASNNWDAASKGRHQNLLKTHCPRGHEYAGENLGFKPNGARECKRCNTARLRMSSGWPEHLAYSVGKVPHGFRVDFATGEIISTKRRIANV